MNADTGMDPYGEHGERLHDGEPWRHQPVGKQDRLVHGIGVEQALGDARADDTKHQQERNRQAERDLDPLPRRQAQRLPHIDRPQRVGVVNEEGRKQKRGAGGGPPRGHGDVEGDVGNVEGHEQETMRRQVTDDETQQDEPACQPEIVPPRPGIPVQEIPASGFWHISAADIRGA